MTATFSHVDDIIFNDITFKNQLTYLGLPQMKAYYDITISFRFKTIEMNGKFPVHPDHVFTMSIDIFEKRILNLLESCLVWNLRIIDFDKLCKVWNRYDKYDILSFFCFSYSTQSSKGGSIKKCQNVKFWNLARTLRSLQK